MQDRATEIDVANPLKILSEYFTTSATDFKREEKTKEYRNTKKEEMWKRLMKRKIEKN